MIGKTATSIRRPCHIFVSFSCEKPSCRPILPAGRTCDGLKADGNYGGGSAAGIPPAPDIPQDPTSPEIKVPSHWLKGVVKFTDTAMRRARTRPLDMREFCMDRRLAPFFLLIRGEQR